MIRLHNPAAAAAERCLVLALEPGTQPGRWLLRLASGESFQALTGAQVFGPFHGERAQQEYDKLAARLRGLGYGDPPRTRESLDRLQASDRGVRARAAARLAWSDTPETVIPVLLAAAAQATSELPVLVDALARLGAAEALPLARDLAGKKLLSRRRSGVEALRRLGDEAGLTAARERGLERLGEPLRTLLAGLDEQQADSTSVATLVEALTALEPLKRGPLLDQLYEFGTPLCVRVALDLLCTEIGAVHLWRYQKSVLKRALLRDDAPAFAELGLAIERKARTTSGQRQTVKSGLTGNSHSTRLFSPATQRWLLRRLARQLRLLAGHAPQRYVEHAVELLGRYRADDARVPRGTIGPFGWCWLLHELLYAEDPRFRRDSWSVLARFAGKQAHATPFDPAHVARAELFETRPRAYLRLANAPLPDVQAFARAGLQRHLYLLAEATPAELAPLLDLDHAGLAGAALDEARRRLAREEYDAALVGALLDGGPRAFAVAEARLQALPQLAALRPAAVLLLLLRHTEQGRSAAAAAVLLAFGRASADARGTLAAYLLQRLAAGRDLDRHGGTLQVLAGLARDAAPLVELADLLEWIERGQPALQALAGQLLAVHPQAATLDRLQLVRLAESEVPAVRAAACAWVRHAAAQLALDPSPLLLLAESAHADNRAVAFELLDGLPADALPLDTLVALCDSNQAPVQRFARDLVRRQLDRLDGATLLQRLAEHPYPTMREFALELVELHLAPGAAALARLRPFLQAALLSRGLGRAVRDRLLAWLESRGLADAAQGAAVAALLNLVLRSANQRDFALVARALSRIQLAWPGLRSDWQLAGAQPC